MEHELCENCGKPITGKVTRTDDDYPLCSDCVDCFEPPPKETQQ